MATKQREERFDDEPPIGYDPKTGKLNVVDEKEKLEDYDDEMEEEDDDA